MVRQRSPKPLIKVRFLTPLPYHKLTLIRGLFYCPGNGVEYENVKRRGESQYFLVGLWRILGNVFISRVASHLWFDYRFN